MNNVKKIDTNENYRKLGTLSKDELRKVYLNSPLLRKDLREQYEDYCMEKVEKISDYFYDYVKDLDYSIGVPTIMEVDFDYRSDFIDGVVNAAENEDFLKDKVEWIRSANCLDVSNLVCCEFNKILKRKDDKFFEEYFISEEIQSQYNSLNFFVNSKYQLVEINGDELTEY